MNLQSAFDRLNEAKRRETMATTSNESMRDEFDEEIDIRSAAQSARIHIPTPKTNRKLLNESELAPNYQRVNLMLPSVRPSSTSALNSAKTTTSEMRSTRTARFKGDATSSLVFNDKIAATSENIASEDIEPISEFTKRLNTNVDKVWFYLGDKLQSSTIESGSKSLENSSRVPKLTPRLKNISFVMMKEAQDISGVFKDVSSLIDSYRETQESKTKRDKVEKVQVSPVKTQKIKRKSEQVKERVEARLGNLLRNDEEFQKLEAEILEYETRNKIMNKENRKAGIDKVKKNKQLPPDYRQQRETSIKAKSDERDRMLEEVRNRRLQIEYEHMQRKEDIALREERKRRRAEKRREDASTMAARVELATKWSFLSVFISRYVKLASEFLRKRQVRALEEQQRRITVMIYTKMMPILWRRRSQQWKSAWEVFKKYWIFYRLWIGVKKKKESAMIIRNFLTDTNTSLILVRQVHLFRSRVYFAQKLIRKWYSARQTKIMIASFQYSIVEAKLLLKEPLNSQRQAKIIEDKKKKNLKKKELIRTRSSTIGTVEEEKKKRGVTFADDASSEGTSAEEFKEDPNAFHIRRASWDLKRELITRDLTTRRIEYDEAMTNYKRDKKAYEHKVQQQMYFQKARNIMKSSDSKQNIFSNFEAPKEFTDENGKTIQKPAMPIYKTFKSEEEILQLVLEGNKRLKELESSYISNAEKQYITEYERQEYLQIEKHRYYEEVGSGYDRMRKFFGPKIWNRYSRYMGPDGSYRPEQPKEKDVVRLRDMKKHRKSFSNPRKPK